MTRSFLKCAPGRGARRCRGFKGRRIPHDRRGVAVVLVLSCLLLVTALLATMVQATLMHRRQLRMEKHARQAELMVDAGLMRATQELDLDPDYKGETWSLGEVANQKAQVLITIDSSGASESSGEQGRTIRATAQFPGEGPHAVRRSLEIPYKR